MNPRSSLSFALAVAVAGGAWPADAAVVSDYSASHRFTVLGAGQKYPFVDSVATDSNGTVYVAELPEGTIRKFLPDGTVTAVAALIPAPNGERVPLKASYPVDLAADGNGNIYVATGHDVFKIGPDGATSKLADDLSQARGIAVDANGNVYVVDGHAIRKISSSGTVTDFAGQPGEPGSSDGTDAARFSGPSGIAVDTDGTIFVADTGNNAIRKITPDGAVSTVIATRFRPLGMAVDLFGNLYTTDSDGVSSGGYRVQRITPERVVTTLQVLGGFAERIEAGFLTQIAVDRKGVIYVTDGWYGALLMSEAPPRLFAPLASQRAAFGATATFQIEADGAAPLGYQWLKDGAAIPGATDATLTISDVQPPSLGNYAVRVTNAVGSVISNPAALSLPVATEDGLAKFSIRGRLGPDAQPMIVGFIVGETNDGGKTSTSSLLVRGVGPTLGACGVFDFLPDPTMRLYSGTTLVASNDNWSGDPQISAVGARVGTFALASDASRDAALLVNLGPDAYTAVVSSARRASGVVLVEIFDATSADAIAFPSRLTNVSAVAPAGSGSAALVANFQLAGSTDKTLLIRAVGPGLASFGIAAPLLDPKIELVQGPALLHSNDNWGGEVAVVSAAGKVGAFALEAASRDAALLVTVPPGSYSARVSGTANATGVVLLEIYQIP
jgi:sugar lactone lactonase YvrE